MNAIHTISSKFFQTVGNGASYILWGLSALTILGLVLAVVLFDTPARLIIGQFFAAVVFAMAAMLLVIVGCAKVLRARGEF